MLDFTAKEICWFFIEITLIVSFAFFYLYIIDKVRLYLHKKDKKFILDMWIFEDLSDLYVGILFASFLGYLAHFFFY